MAPKKAPVEKGAGTKDSQVIKRLHQILKTADLEKTTVKNIQKQLEAELGVPMSDRKQFIREEVRCRTEFLFFPSPNSSISARANGAERAPIQTPLRPRVFPIIPANGKIFKRALTPITPLPPLPSGREVPEVQRRQEDWVSTLHAQIRTRPQSPSAPRDPREPKNFLSRVSKFPISLASVGELNFSARQQTRDLSLERHVLTFPPRLLSTELSARPKVRSRANSRTRALFRPQVFPDRFYRGDSLGFISKLLLFLRRYPALVSSPSPCPADPLDSSLCNFFLPVNRRGRCQGQEEGRQDWQGWQEEARPRQGQGCH